MLKFVRRFNHSSLVRADIPQSVTKVASKSSTLYEIQEFQHDSLKKYFEENALLFPVETIIDKVGQKDFNFFLSQTNFLKVVDTLEKFQEGMINRESPQAKDFVIFKRELYQMYQIQNRSIYEHELYSFNLQREDIKWLSKANRDFIMEKVKYHAIDQVADAGRLKGKIYKRRMLNPKRLKGLSAFAASYGIYSYMPYIAVSLGSTIPVFAACFAGLYGMFAFSESQCVNTIEVIREGTHEGKLRINVAQSAFASKNIVVDIKDVRQVACLANDDIGEENLDGNVISIAKHFDESSGREVTEDIMLSVPGDALRDRDYLAWVFAEKGGEEQTTDDFNDLLYQQHVKLASGQGFTQVQAILSDYDQLVTSDDAKYVDLLIETNDQAFQDNLPKLQQAYGKEFLASLSDKQLYSLYREFLSRQV